MKRLSAKENTDVRERTESDAEQILGQLTEKEIEEIRQAYLDGCRGEVIIGLRGDERVITMLVPALPDSSLSEMNCAILDLLCRLGCNRCICIHCEVHTNSIG